MNILKEAQSLIGFATYYPLLYKSTSDEDKPTTGYAIEEIIKISYLSSQHRLYLVEFLLDKLLTSQWQGKQKIVRILLQLSKKGHYEIRILLRQKDGILRKAASQGSVLEPGLGNSPDIFFNSSLQELLAYIFDSSISMLDDQKLQKGELEDVKISNVNCGYGSSSISSTGKYVGFGNASHVKQESIANQVYEFVGNAMASSEKNREAYLRSLMVSDKGNYRPITAEMLEWSTDLDAPPLEDPPVKDLILQASAIHKRGPPVVHCSGVSLRGKGYVPGKAGGGWASDEDEEESISLQKMSLVETEASVREKGSLAEEDFINQFLDDHNLWPIRKFDVFLKTGTQMDDLGLNKEKIMIIIINKINEMLDNFTNIQQKKLDDPSITDSEKAEYSDYFYLPWQPLIPKIEGDEAKVMILLLFIEYCYHTWSTPLIVNKICFSFLTKVGEFKWCHSCIRNKAQKLTVYLTVDMTKLAAKTQQNN